MSSLGPPMMPGKLITTDSHNFSQQKSPINGHNGADSHLPPMPISTTMGVAGPPQVRPVTMNSHLPNSPPSQMTGHTIQASVATNNQGPPRGMRPNAPDSYPYNSTQQNGGWTSQPNTVSNSIAPFSGQTNTEARQPSLQQNISTNPLVANQNYIPSVATTLYQAPSQTAPNPPQPRFGIQPPPTGPTLMAGSQVNPGNRPLNPITNTNVPPTLSMATHRQSNPSIRQRYPNMMPPPISSTQQNTMQQALPPLNTNTSVQQTVGYRSPAGFPPISSAPNSTHEAAPVGMPSPPISNQSIGGRPNHGMPPPVSATSTISQRIGGLSLSQGGDAIDLLQNRHILPPRGTKIPAPKPRLQAELWNTYNCSTDIFRSTLTKVTSMPPQFHFWK